MKLVLREDVEKLGRKGDLVEVADGYARNYLVPRGLAMLATRGVVKQAEAMRRNRLAKEARDLATAREQVALLGSRRISVVARAGEGGKLFGSVTASDIAEAVQAQTGVEIDRRRIHLEESLRELGAYEVTVRIFGDVDATLALDVVAAE